MARSRLLFLLALQAAPAWARLGVSGLLERLDRAPEAEQALLIQAIGARHKKKALPDVLKRLDVRGAFDDRQRAVVWALGEMGGPEASAALLGAWRALEGKDGPDAASLRAALLEALARTGSSEVPPLLRGALGSPDPTLRARAIAGLAAYRDEASADALAKAASPQDPQAQAACEALGALKSAAAGAALAAASGDPRVEVRLAAAYGRARRGDKSGWAALDEGAGQAGPAALLPASYLVRLGRDRGLGILSRALGDADPAVRVQAGTLLAATGDKRAALLLADRLAKEAPEMRRSFVELLGRVGGDRARYELARLRKDPDPQTRELVRRALARLGDYEAP